MINEDLAITRGTGIYSKVFDFVASTPAKDITSTQQWMLQVMDKVSPLIFKYNAQVTDGADDQILLTTVDDTVTVYLSETERNQLPDSGYSYKLYWFNDSNEWEIMAYGDITASGEVPLGSIPVEISWVNDNNFLSSKDDFTLTHTMDTIYCTATLAVEQVLALPGANTMPGKRFEIKNIGQGTVRINTPDGVQLINLDLNGDSVHIKAKGADANDWECFYA